jgi:cysteine-rich repeat protein
MNAVAYAGNRRSKRRLAVAVFLALVTSGTAAGQPLQRPRGARIGAALARALERPLPAEGLAIAVVLREADLPARGAERRAAVNARQQVVLDALPSGGLRLKHRYRSLAGFAGWAGRAAVEALSRRDDVELVYLDGRVHAALAQGVPLVGADTAHARGYTGAGVKVAVLDTGIDTDHPDLADDVAAQHCFCDDHPSPSLGCCPGGDDEEANAEDDNGHGTNVAGIITSGGVASSVGVAPDAKIVAVKVLDANGDGSFSDVAAALDWVLTERGVVGGPVEGTRIVNLSLGDGGEYDDATAEPCQGSNTALAIAALHQDGVAVFVASGNEGHDAGIAFPACVAQAISVGGVYDASLGSASWTACSDYPTAADVFVCHTNSGQLLDLLAPDWRTTTAKLGGGTVAFGGTSASSPYAAAEAAILLQADAELTPEDVRTLLKANGPQVTNPDNGLSFTRSDVGEALLQVVPPVCGNGIVEGGEDCDDGGTAGGDCCSASCGFESLGSPCDDGDACTESDFCDGGACEPGPPLVCDDGAFCNGEETCDSGSGCLSGTPPATGDGVDCTVDSCDEDGDVVVHAPDDSLCDDGLYCNGSETCDAIDDCQPGVPPPTDDGVACTIDSCDEVGDSVVHAPDDSICDDGLYCNGSETCDVIDDCQPGVPPPTDDGVACTIDSCDEVGDSVVHAPDDLQCDDADDCTADSCDAFAGCTHEPIALCGTSVPATPRGGPAVLGLLVLASGSVLLARRRANVSKGGSETAVGAEPSGK